MRRVHVSVDILNNKQAGQTIAVDGDRAHYLRDVLRLQPGDLVELFDGQGKSARTEIVEVDDAVHLRIDSIKTNERGESPVEITLFQGIPKGKRWEWLLEKVTELGVSTIIPLETARTVVTVPDDRLDHKMTRWNKKLAAASRQSGRTVIPDLQQPQELGAIIDSSQCDIHLIAHPGDHSPTVMQALANTDTPPSSVGIWIGPEGGFSDEEVDQLVDAGAGAVGLGPRILRTDTAAIAAVTLIQAAVGDLSPS